MLTWSNIQGERRTRASARVNAVRRRSRKQGPTAAECSAARGRLLSVGEIETTPIQHATDHSLLVTSFRCAFHTHLVLWTRRTLTARTIHAP